MMTNAELEAKLKDLQSQVDWLFERHGPARWSHIVAQRKAAGKLHGTKSPSNPGNLVYRPKDHEAKQ
jgi:hypothetical protein